MVKLCVGCKLDEAVPEDEGLGCQHEGYCCWCGSEQPEPMYCNFYEVPFQIEEKEDR